jgi:hypothetical protein
VSSTTVSGLAQALPLFTNTNPNPSPQGEKVIATTSTGTDVPKDIFPIPADTVSLSAQSKLALTEIKKEERPLEAAKREKAKKEDTNILSSEEQVGGVVSKVQFVYDLKGEVKVQYLDTVDRLIYQVPSELMLRLKEAALKANSAVDTKA